MAKPPPPTIGTIRLKAIHIARSWDEKNGKERSDVHCHHARTLNVLRRADSDDLVTHRLNLDEHGNPPYICRDPSASGVCTLVIYAIATVGGMEMGAPAA